jgi:hypothetical protein
MNSQLTLCPRSSLETAAFRCVVTPGRHGLLCRVRRDIMTLRQLYQDPGAATGRSVLQGRLRTSQSIKTWTARRLEAGSAR